MSLFGQHMKALIKTRGLTLRQFGKLVQMSHGNLSKILNGSHEAPNPPVGTDLEMWFDALGTSEAEEPALRLLAAAAHCRSPQARSELEAFVLAHASQACDVVPRRRADIRRAADATGTEVPSTRTSGDA